MKKRKSQCERIIEYIKRRGSITVRQMEVELDINSPTRRIADLRAKGYTIESEKKSRKNRHGEKVPFVVYYLRGEPK